MQHDANRRSFLGLGLGLITAQMIPTGKAMGKASPQEADFLRDFDNLWQAILDKYCFFHEKNTDWDAVRRLYRPQIQTATSSVEFAKLINRVLIELYDAHTRIKNLPADGPRGPYFDLWVEPISEVSAVVTSVREGSAAEDAGVLSNDVIHAVDNIPLQTAAAEFLPRCLLRPDPAATAYAFNVAVSGRRAQPRTLSIVRDGGDRREIRIPVKSVPKLPDVESRILDDGIGYIVIRSFADSEVIAAFDRALFKLRDTQSLIIDVRQNGGGDTAVARPIMGRFISEKKPYARMRRREGVGLSEPWTEFVKNRGPFTYRAPVIVLTSRWSASMAEGFPMGMRAIGRGLIVGTPMMRLGAAVVPIKLESTGLELQYSAEPVYDIQDKPRWLLDPDVLVGGGKDALQKALQILK